MSEIINKTIVDLIKAARAERGYTQKDLADHLGKTSAAISDLERGKVQVSASELYQIAQFLNKPIEYFYGERMESKEIQDFIALLRRESKQNRSQVLELASQMVRLQGMVDYAQTQPKDDKVPTELIAEFQDAIRRLAPPINAWAKTINDLNDQFNKGLKLQELEKPSGSKTKTK